LEKSLINIGYRIPEHFINVKLDEFQIMPNHLHGIIVIRNSSVGARSPRPLGFPRPILGQMVGYFKYQSTKLINILMNTLYVLNLIYFVFANISEITQ